MKKPKKNDRGPYLQKSNNRWQWMAGATAATAAGVTASQASAITINLLNNYVSASGGNHLNADVTGDGHPDLVITNASYRFIEPRSYNNYFNRYYAGVALNGVHAQAFASNDYGFGSVRLGLQSKYFGARSVTHGVHPYASVTGSIPIFFKDLHINGGAPTRGSLEVTVFAATFLNNSTRVQLDSVTYNAPGGGSRLGLSVPDQGSSLGLLAMGAGGVLALRRWRATQARS
jgi:hypothetical protein